MKTLLTAVALLLSVSSFAATSSLFAREGNKLINLEKVVRDGEDVQVSYDFDTFCYKGMAQTVVKKMEAWNKMDLFYSGGGGGFVLRSLKINRGIVTWDIVMSLEDEVVPEDGLRNVIIKPCR